MVDFRMPSLGADMEAGTLVEWLVRPGDKVKRGDIVAIVETQKGAIEIETFEFGEIEQILVDLNAKVPVGTPLARIRTEVEPKGGAAEGCSGSRPADRAAGAPDRPAATADTGPGNTRSTTYCWSAKRCRPHSSIARRTTAGGAARNRSRVRHRHWHRWCNHSR